MDLPKEFIVLCDTEVPIIIFSNTSKLFGFSSSGSKTVTKKQQYSLVMGDVEKKRTTSIEKHASTAILCNDDKKVSHQDIKLVRNLIERCLQLYMNRDEVLKKQIILFNHLLKHQYHMIKYTMPPKEEFAPVKNANGSDYNTPDNARLLVLRLHTRWVAAASGFLTHSVLLYATGNFTVDFACSIIALLLVLVL
ncbi:hypothetical protein CXB51_032262 [Gossypium anomalum]|uniref:MADS-box domain-containing protein n=1 Tax=Gossypium anomalum TaxID=47600 RepID=A0A8J5XSC3_9ROSI|nr:hypothetical protein CXB51_032262 [Gossypium anomalum]